MIQSDRESSKLFVAVCAFVIVAFVYFLPIFFDIIKIRFAFTCGYYLRFGLLRAATLTNFYLLRKQNSVQRTIAVGIAFLPNRANCKQGGYRLTYSRQAHD